MIVSRTQPTSGQRFVTSTNWEGYLSVLEAFKGRRIKITYDQGELELLSPSRTHEQTKKVLSSIIEFAGFERNVSFFGGGATTFRRKLLDRGLEPDECYYFNTERLEGPEVSEEEYPAPDLAIEVEFTQSALNRLGIFQALGVREVWRYTAQHQVFILSLESEGYMEVEKSGFLPFLPPADIVRFAQRGLELRDTTRLFRELRDWLGQ